MTATPRSLWEWTWNIIFAYWCSRPNPDNIDNIVSVCRTIRPLSKKKDQGYNRSHRVGRILANFWHAQRNAHAWCARAEPSSTKILETCDGRENGAPMLDSMNLRIPSSIPRHRSEVRRDSEPARQGDYQASTMTYGYSAASVVKSR